MKELLTFLAQHILPHGDSVEIIEEQDETGSFVYTLYTHPDDTGIAIGKNGKTVHALREILKVQAMQKGIRVNLTIKSSDEKDEGGLHTIESLSV